MTGLLRAMKTARINPRPTCASTCDQQSGLVSVRNPAARQIVRRYLNRYTVAFEDTNAKAAEFAGDGCQHCRAIVQRHTKRRARKDFGDGPFEFYQVFFGDTVL